MLRNSSSKEQDPHTSSSNRRRWAQDRLHSSNNKIDPRINSSSHSREQDQHTNSSHNHSNIINHSNSAPHSSRDSHHNTSSREPLYVIKIQAGGVHTVAVARVMQADEAWQAATTAPSTR